MLGTSPRLMNKLPETRVTDEEKHCKDTASQEGQGEEETKRTKMRRRNIQIIRIMQKIINVIAVASGVVSLAVVGVGGYVYVNQESIIESVKEKALGGLGSALGGGALPSLPSPTAPQSTPSLPVPNSPL